VNLTPGKSIKYTTGNQMDSKLCDYTNLSAHNTDHHNKKAALSREDRVMPRVVYPAIPPGISG